MFGIRRAALIAAICLFGLVPVTGSADLVTGRVTGIPANSTFVIEGNNLKRIVSTDAQGNYQVYLEPGVYTAKFDNKKATIRGSSKAHFVQNIHFK